MTVEERIDKGIRLLEEHDPLWYRQINVCDLRMESCYNCVLGQVFGWYFDGLAALGLNGDESVQYGFENEGGDQQEYDDLGTAWQHAVESYEIAT